MRSPVSDIHLQKYLTQKPAFRSHSAAGHDDTRRSSPARDIEVAAIPVLAKNTDVDAIQ
jgi:hypothetical protein